MARWKIQKHKVEIKQQEVQVSYLVNDMEHTGGADSESWAKEFHKRLTEIKKTNYFGAEFGYKATPRNQTSLEVWKMKRNGDYNYKMFTISLLDTKPYNPFNF